MFEIKTQVWSPPNPVRFFRFDSGTTITLYNSSFNKPWRADINDNSGTIYTGWGDTKVESIRDLRVTYLRATDPKFKAVMDRLDPIADPIVEMMKRAVNLIPPHQRQMYTYINRDVLEKLKERGLQGYGNFKAIQDELDIQLDKELAAYRVSIKNKVHNGSDRKIHSGIKEQIRDGVIPGQKPKRKRWDK